MSDETVTAEQNVERPKWYRKAKERMAMMKRLAVGTDVHLLEMACSDYDEQARRIAELEREQAAYKKDNADLRAANDRLATPPSASQLSEAQIELLQWYRWFNANHPNVPYPAPLNAVRDAIELEHRLGIETRGSRDG